MPAPSLSEITSALLYPNNWWSGPVITYSLPGAIAVWSGYSPSEEPFDPHYTALNPEQTGRFAAAVAAWDAVAGLTLVETNDTVQPGQIRVAYTDVDNFQSGNVWGYAQSPPYRGGSGSNKTGDIWIDYGKTG